MTNWIDKELTLEIKAKGALTPEQEEALSEALKNKRKDNEWNIPEPDDKEFVERTKYLIERASIEARFLYKGRKPKVRSQTCKECGCTFDKFTEGCKKCSRRKKGREYYRGIRVKHECKGCGCSWDEKTPGCVNCKVRHFKRKKAQEKRQLSQR